jgi:hypothetical protein
VARLEGSLRQERDHGLERESRFGRALDVSNQLAELVKPLDVEGQEDQVQDEHRVDLTEESVCDERDVARDGAASQGEHGLHVERGQHEDRRDVANRFEPGHRFSSLRNVASRRPATPWHEPCHSIVGAS